MKRVIPPWSICRISKSFWSKSSERGASARRASGGTGNTPRKSSMETAVVFVESLSEGTAHHGILLVSWKWPSPAIGILSVVLADRLYEFAVKSWRHRGGHNASWEPQNLTPQLTCQDSSISIKANC